MMRLVRVSNYMHRETIRNDNRYKHAINCNLAALHLLGHQKHASLFHFKDRPNRLRILLVPRTWHWHWHWCIEAFAATSNIKAHDQLMIMKKCARLLRESWMDGWMERDVSQSVGEQKSRSNPLSIVIRDPRTRNRGGVRC